MKTSSRSIAGGFGKWVVLQPFAVRFCAIVAGYRISTAVAIQPFLRERSCSATACERWRPLTTAQASIRLAELAESRTLRTDLIGALGTG